MSVNSSSSSNASLHRSPLTSSMSIVYHLHRCFNSPIGGPTATTLAIISIFILLPLSVLVLYLGLQRWRTQPSGTTMSHSDHFTYHVAVIELMSVIGSILIRCGVHTGLPQMMIVGIYLVTFNFNGQMFFHLLTCMERYLAVVHPITYLSLRTESVITKRNIVIGCVWLLSFAVTSATFLEQKDPVLILYFFCVAFNLIVVFFCSLSVSCVLIRPGPGEGGGGRQRVDRLKLRAFYTIMAILGVLLIRLGGKITTTALYNSLETGELERCAVWLTVFWFCLPSSLVLPLLFLQRAGKLLCLKNSNKSRSQHGKHTEAKVTSPMQQVGRMVPLQCQTGSG